MSMLTPAARATRRSPAAAAAGGAYLIAVALLAYAWDADQDGRAWGDDVSLTLVFVVAALQPVVGYAMGWPAFPLLAAPAIAIWWVERDYEPGLFEVVSGPGLAVLYAVWIGAPLTGLGAIARALRRRSRAASPR